jgi:hypothetical protein
MPIPIAGIVPPDFFMPIQALGDTAAAPAGVPGKPGKIPDLSFRKRNVALWNFLTDGPV